LCSTVGSATHS